MKIGIITMHRVLNYGSALQAFATQWILESLGFESEIIDYEYKGIKKKKTLRNRLIHGAVCIREALRGFPQKRKQRRFESFYSKYYRLTKEYYTENSIKQRSPLYDVYISGSDQIWNPRFAGNDVNFMLAFAPSKKPRISFASSFATDIIDEAHAKLYAPLLNMYDVISVREQSGVEIVKTLTGKDASVCCDPTLFLSNDIRHKLSAQSAISFKFRYILVYGLYYMFDPYPYLYDIINSVSRQLNCRVVYLDGRNADLFKTNAKVVSDAGPCEFLWLFEHADFVITTSFHGTVFSLLYDKPFYSVVDKSAQTDSRITSLCKLAKAERSLIDYKESPSLDNILSLKGDCVALDKFKEESLLYLKSNLNKYN